jgi:ferredoxin-like protein FixX
MNRIEFEVFLSINVREYRRDNQKYTIQRNWQHRRRKTKQKHNTIMCWTPLYEQTQIK